MLRTRALSAMVLLVLVAVFLWWGGIPWLVAIVLVALLGMQEFFSALRQNKYHPARQINIDKLFHIVNDE